MLKYTSEVSETSKPWLENPSSMNMREQMI